MGPGSWLPWLFAGVFLLILAAGLALFFLAQAKAVGAVTAVIGSLGIIASLLSAFFTTFTVIAMLALSLGVSILVWVLSVTSGFEDAFQRKVLGVNAHVLVLKYGVDFREYRDVMKVAEKMADVKAVSPFLFNTMMIGRGNRLSSVLVKGIEPRQSARVLDLPRHVVAPKRGRSLHVLLKRDKGRLPPLILGKTLANKLEVGLGDVVRLISPLTGLDVAGWSVDRDAPRSMDFRVSGVFDSGFAEYDSRLIYVHMADVQAFFGQGDVVTGVELKIAQIDDAQGVARRLYRALGGAPYRTIDWSELNHNLFTALKMQKIFLQWVVGFFLSVVVCFNVVAALAMMVIRKTREIAALKALGMSDRGVFGVFVACGTVIWLLGAGIGLCGGYMGCLLLRQYGFALESKIYLIGELPVVMNPTEFMVTALIALGVCLFGTLYPALRAARLRPVEALHTVRLG